MKFNAHGYTVIALALVCLIAYHYRSKYTDQLNTSIKLQSELLEQQNEIVNQQERIRLLSELDNQHTKELAHAKSEIDVLRNDVAAGRRRLRITATCHQGDADSSGSVGHADTPRLNPATEQDYFDFRRMIVENEQQIKYLQDYIKTQCQ
ncbi:lysis protein [Photorhabdus laumondii subsp. laumondii]|uniref:Lysis protein n=1 Tax=Photorhabdus laumondii subsp. laumondii TaxID=141679 RepID=A0A6L9JQ40_PHOLM|nr:MULTISPECIES: lysis protein [Photorhabdus]AXG42669.1 lysis protein [Photorhabdus laumondii subsp. laumondii]MCC8384739.1 lysis protein [Photorhabdus laumondii]MCC8413476.1 lysis protein [Photorhabdus laumondii]NDK96478.1 lysis protein [Photorhabdus laumondii subsp. laumondii]NDL17949.1 lysis protein [Photorhabdus laumondii subsp. laumondii]